MSFHSKLHSLLFPCHALCCKTLPFLGFLNPLSASLVWSMRGSGGRLQSRMNEWRSQGASVLCIPWHLQVPQGIPFLPFLATVDSGKWFKLWSKFQMLGSIVALCSYAPKHVRWKLSLMVTNLWIVSSFSAWLFLSSVSSAVSFLNQFESLGELSIFLLGSWLQTHGNPIKHEYEML